MMAAVSFSFSACVVPSSCQACTHRKSRESLAQEASLELPMELRLHCDRSVTHLRVLRVLQDGGLQQQHGCVQVALPSLLLALGEGIGPLSIRVAGVQDVSLVRTVGLRLRPFN